MSDRMSIPFVDLAAHNRQISRAAAGRMADVVASGSLILGDEVREFERRFASLCGMRHAVGASSGTSALTLALRALEIGPGDEVVSVSNSFIATVAAIALVGADAVLVDVDENEAMDPEAVRGALTTRTRAILPVHLRGRPAQVEEVAAIAGDSGIAMVEDCAQGVGSQVGGRHIGTFGEMGCFSLHPLKNLSAWGDAGVVVTNDDELAEKLRQLRNHGLRDRDTVERWGENARLDAIQAAVLNVKLDYLSGWNRRRRELAAAYRTHLDDTSLELPVDHPGHTYHHFVVRSNRRDEIRSALAKAGVETRVHYPVPTHRQPCAVSHCRASGSLRRTERDARRIVSLPMYPELTLEAVEYTAACLRSALPDG